MLASVCRLEQLNCYLLWVTLVWVSLSPLMKTTGCSMRSLVIKIKMDPLSVEGEQNIVSVRIVIVAGIAGGKNLIVG